MACRFLQLIAVALVLSALGQSEILQIRWPTAATTPKDDCYTELTKEHLNIPILVNHTVYDWRRPCLIRIPTQTEVVFTLARTDSRSSLRVVAGNSQSIQHMASAKLQKIPNTDLTFPVYVGCRYATIVFRPFFIDDYLLFIVRPARVSLIEEEDKDACSNVGQDDNKGHPRRQQPF